MYSVGCVACWTRTEVTLGVMCSGRRRRLYLGPLEVRIICEMKLEVAECLRFVLSALF